MFYIFIITLLVQTPIVAESLNLNVRTTLFTPADLAKKRWTKREVALLRARMYFQNMIPPVEVSRSPDYINSLIRYIDDSYAALDQSAFDADTGKILKVAASDVFGGYLKMVALPVTKLAYYSGDISTQEALKLFKYYEHIKDQLRTTGKGWSEALKNIYNPKKVRGIRSEAPVSHIKNPCKRLLYFKNNQRNVSMPMPAIDWDTRKMVVPLTDTPVVDLKSPHMSSVLQQFHQIASDCERSITRTPNNKYFQGTFEDWVSEAVVPHLSDEDLYTAFKGILSLLDDSYKPQIIIERAKPSNSSKTTPHKKISKKKIVVVFLVALELICCIPTILYCVFKMKKKIDSKFGSSSRGTSSGKKYSNNKKNNKKKPKTSFYEPSPRSTSCCCGTKSTSRVNSAYHRNFMKNINCGMTSASGTRCSYTSLTEALTTADEAVSIRSSHEITKRSLQYKITETDQVDVTQGQTQVSKTYLIPRKSSTSTIRNTSNDTGETITLSTVLPQDTNTSNLLRKSKRFRPRHVLESLDPDTFKPNPILANISTASISKTVKELKLDIFDDSLNVNVMRLNNPKNVEFVSPRASKTRSKTSINSKNECQENANITRPLSEKISRQKLPKDKVLPKNRKGILKSAEERTIKANASKIPKRINLPMNSSVCSSPRGKWVEPTKPGKSMIPTLGQVLEDSTSQRNMIPKQERGQKYSMPHKNMVPNVERAHGNSTPQSNMMPKVERAQKSRTPLRNMVPNFERALEDSTPHRNIMPKLERTQDNSAPNRTTVLNLERALDDSTSIPKLNVAQEGNAPLTCMVLNPGRALEDSTAHRNIIPKLDGTQADSVPHRNMKLNFERAQEDSTAHRNMIPRINMAQDDSAPHRNMKPNLERPQEDSAPHRTMIPKLDRTPLNYTELLSNRIQTLKWLADDRALHRTRIPTQERTQEDRNRMLDDGTLRTVIPQPDRTLNVITLYRTIMPKHRTDGRARIRTKIPTRRWALDDSALHSSSRRARKLNVTL